MITYHSYLFFSSRRRHTRSKRDWSSDVCSSDLWTYMTQQHEHNHTHNHTHGHVHTNNKKILLISFLIISIFMIVEIIGGFLAHSLALLSDGLHMFSDSISLGVALLAFIYSEKH